MIHLSSGIPKTMNNIENGRQSKMDQVLIAELHWTPLHCMVEKNDIASVKNLLEQGTTINDLDKFNRTPLSIAASNGYFPIVKILVDKGASIDEGCPLHYSCEKGHLDIVEYLVEKGASINSGQNPPLAIAICNDHVEVAKFLIEKGADIDAVNENKESILHCACDRGNEELVSLLIERGCQINVKDKWKLTPLYIVLIRQEDKPQLVKILLENGASAKLDDDFESALFHASHPEAVTELVKHGEDVDIQNDDGETPLYTFCSYKMFESAKTILEFGATPNISRKGGWTPLHCAAAEADLDFIKLLLDYGANVNAASSTNVIPLHLAADRGNLDIVSELLKKDSFVKVPVLAPDINSSSPSYINDNIVEGATPFSLASAKEFEEVCQILAKSNQNSDWPGNKFLEMVIANNLEIANKNCDIHDLIGWTALHHSVYRSYNTLTSLLLENGASVNAKDNFNRTPLSLAAFKNDLKLLNLLLDKGADVNEGYALLYATEGNAIDCVKELVKRKCDVNIKNQKPAKNSALFKASPEIMKILLENGANPGIVNAYGETPLHEVCRNGSLEATNLLLNSGANANSKDDCNDTPLLNACLYKEHDIDIVNLLLKRGANLNDINKYLETPLHYAAVSGFEEAVDELIKAGALLDLDDDEGKTPLFVCAEHPKIVGKLAQSGADVNYCSKRGGWTPLHFGIEGKNESFNELLKNGARVNAASAEFVLPIYVASIFGFVDAVECLIECGSLVDPYILHYGVLLEDNPPKRYHVIPGNTPLIGAASKGHLDVLKVLCKHGASVKTVNCKGNSALHEAVSGGFEEVVRFLLEMDSGLKSVRNGEQKTPADLAKDSSNLMMLKLLT